MIFPTAQLRRSTRLARNDSPLLQIAKPSINNLNAIGGPTRYKVEKSMSGSVPQFEQILTDIYQSLRMHVLCPGGVQLVIWEPIVLIFPSEHRLVVTVFLHVVLLQFPEAEKV